MDTALQDRFVRGINIVEKHKKKARERREGRESNNGKHKSKRNHDYRRMPRIAHEPHRWQYNSIDNTG